MANRYRIQASEAVSTTGRAARAAMGAVLAAALVAGGAPALLAQPAYADDDTVQSDSAYSESIQAQLNEAYGTTVNVEYEDGVYNVYDDDVTFYDYWVDHGGFLVLEYSEGDTVPLAEGFQVVIDEELASDGLRAYQVTQTIQSLPTFTGDNADEVLAALDAAQAAYDDLTADQQAMVENYSIIANTRAMIAEAQAEEGEPAASGDSSSSTPSNETAGASSKSSSTAAAATSTASKSTAASKNAAAKKKAKAVKVTGVKVKAGKKKATVSWKKKSGYKYQVWYKKSGAKKAKTVKTSSIKKTVKKLTSKKKYTFKVRTYKKVGGKTVYGKWSASKTVKVK